MLFLVIICMASVATIIDTLWSIIGPHGVEEEEILVDGEVFVRVDCVLGEDHPLFYMSFVYAITLRIVLVVVAILTRKIRRKHFKDTKKANLFVFSTLLFAPILLISATIIVTDTILYALLDFVSYIGIGMLYITLFKNYTTTL